jgi:hypothetical protein
MSMNRPNSSAVILGQGDCLGLPPSNTSGNCFRETKIAIGQRSNSIYMPPMPLAACGYSTPSTPSCIYSSRPQQEAEESHHVTFREGTRALDRRWIAVIEGNFSILFGIITLDALPSCGLLTLGRITGTRGALMPNRQLTGACHSLASIPLIRERIATMCRCSLEA